ncbi:MAG: hypothetical protein HY898_04210 [Deltaproteobacteria bacterium]|nr:hypothetical protein [Deltaproteobacteria bacterium]
MSARAQVRIAILVTAVAAAWIGSALGCGGTVESVPAPIDGQKDASPDTHVSQGGSGGHGGTGAGGSAGKAGAGGAGGQAGSGGAPIRTVTVRDLWDKYDAPDNLALDGGFELSGALSSIWGSTGYGSLQFGNGAVCRTGLRCAVLGQGEGLYGFYVSPKTGSVTVTLHTSPANGACDTIAAYVLDAYAPNDYPTPVAIQSAELGTDGWCEIRGDAPSMQLKVPVLYIEAGQHSVTLDDVVVQAPGKYPPSPKPMSLSPALLARTRHAATTAMEEFQRSRKPRARPSAPWTARKAPWMK